MTCKYKNKTMGQEKKTCCCQKCLHAEQQVIAIGTMGPTFEQIQLIIFISPFRLNDY